VNAIAATARSWIPREPQSMPKSRLRAGTKVEEVMAPIVVSRLNDNARVHASGAIVPGMGRCDWGHDQITVHT